uniref:Uncharacterized protein n=1 Tax=Arundo donax TaxID=35708 RepID=A0A0A8XSU7_ARUDO
MVRVMKGMASTLENNCAIANKFMQWELRFEFIQQAMDATVDCGAEEGSAEHLMASTLSVKAENHDMFKTLKTREGRFK